MLRRVRNIYSSTSTNGGSTTLPVSTRGGNNTDNERKGDRYRRWFDNASVCFLAINVMIFLYLYFTPKETVLSHHKQVSDQLVQMAEIIQTQHDLMVERFNYLTKDVDKKEKELEAKTKAEEKLEAKHNDKDAAKIEKMKIEIKELSTEIKNEKGDIEKIKEKIDEDEKKTKADVKTFCESCKFYHEASGLRTTCGARKQFLVDRYGNTEEMAIRAVVEWDPSCQK